LQTSLFGPRNWGRRRSPMLLLFSSAAIRTRSRQSCLAESSFCVSAVGETLVFFRGGYSCGRFLLTENSSCSL
jgi:hypothetical protein